MSVVDEVKQKIDIVEVIGQHVPLAKAGRNFKALCPFHTEKTPSFFVFPERQSWHCFGACGTGGDVFSFVMKQQGIDFGEALRLLAQQAGITIPSKSAPEAGKDEKERLYQANEAAVHFFHDALLNSPAAAKTRDYLLGRGFTSETVTAFQLGFSPNTWEGLKQHLQERGYTEKELLDAGLLVETDDGKTHDRFRNRLMFPIHDARGRTTGFGARVLDDSLPKYTNSPQTLVFDKSGTLYGVDLAAAAIRKQGRAVLVEGYMDAITAHQHGFNNVVASMGTAITERQLTILKRLTRNVTLALDADTAGEEAMLRCVDYENSLDAEVQVIILPSGRDPDNVIREDDGAWQELVESAVPVVDFAFSMKTAKLDLTTAGDQSRAANELLPIIAKMKDSVRRDHYLHKLAILTGIRYNTLEGELKRRLVPAKPLKAKARFTTTSTLRTLLSSPLEEYCLRLLLQYPELRDKGESPLPEHFQNSQNREIFVAWQQVDDLPSLQERLDPLLWEQVESLISQSVLGNGIEDKYIDCVLRLQQQYLRDQKEEEAAVAATAVEEEGAGADLAKLQQEGIESNVQLRDVFNQRDRIRRSTKR